MIETTSKQEAAFQCLFRDWRPPEVALQVDDDSVDKRAAIAALNELGIRVTPTRGDPRENLVVVKDVCVVAYLFHDEYDQFLLINYGPAGTTYSSKTPKGRFTPATFATEGEAR